MECGLSSLVYSYKIVYRDNMYIIAYFSYSQLFYFLECLVDILQFRLIKSYCIFLSYIQ